MLRKRWLCVLGLRAAVVGVAASSLGCFAHSRGETDWDKTPVMSAGAGATIIYPGQTVPTYIPPGANVGAPPGSGYGAPPPGSSPSAPGTQWQAPPGGPPPSTATPMQSGGAPSGAPLSYGSAPTYTKGPNGEQVTGSPAPSGVPMTMIGGAEQRDEGHRSWKEEPGWWKYLALPFAAIAAPFKAVAEAARGGPEPGPEVPHAAPQGSGPGAHVGTPPPPDPIDYETAMVDRLERELESRQPQNAPRAAGASPGRTSPDHGAFGERPLSIAEELAALQRTPGNAPAPRAPDPQRATRDAPTAPPPHSRTVRQPTAAADGVVDRDGDGRIDEWIFRENGEISRVELDETADGQPDRTLHYDLETHQICRVEEDGNGDGVSDSWTDYENGRVARRRGDGNHDGTVDTWSFYRDGEITRHEQDTSGDGFRDRVGYYEGGKLTREVQDRNADGRPDATILYDAQERVTRREEDDDGDGRPDVISYYEDGHLVRRELLQNDDPSTAAGP